MQPFGQVPAFEDGDLKLFGKVFLLFLQFLYISTKVINLKGFKLHIHGHYKDFLYYHILAR